MKTILIMAAGNGSRYGTLKQFDELGPSGEFLFEFTIYDAIAHGFDHVVLITKKAHVAELYAYLKERLPSHIKLDVLAQEVTDLPADSIFSGSRQKPWGTAHAVWTARKVIEGAFAVVNADDYYGGSSLDLASAFIENSTEVTEFGMVPYRLSDTLSAEGSVSRAVCNQEHDYLKEIVEYKEVISEPEGLVDLETGCRFSGEEVTSMNFWIFNSRVFALIEKDLALFVQSDEARKGEEIYIPKQVQKWIGQGKIKVRLTEPCGDWFGVTYANDKRRAVQILEEKGKTNIYPSPLWKKLLRS